MPVVHANGIDINYEVQGEGEPIVLIPYLAADAAVRIPGGRVRQALHLLQRGPAPGLSAKPEGEYTTELLADDVASFMPAAASAGRTSSGSRSALGRHVAGGQVPGSSEVAVAAQRLGQDRPVPARHRRGLADHGQGTGQRDRHGHPGHLPLLLHPGDVAPGRSTSIRWPSSSAAARCRRWTRSSAVRCRPGARRDHDPRRDTGPDPDHVGRHDIVRRPASRRR